MARDQSWAGTRVLVAEDEILAALALEDALTDWGCTVLTAGDGEAALELAARNRVDVLVTDLSMPRMGGLELIPRLRARLPGLPVVVMTGYLPPGGAELLSREAEGPLTVLHKPFSMRQLAEALRQVASLPACTA